MNIKHFEYIIEIYKCGSMNKAAKNCFISQSYISNLVKTLEQEFGFKILNRGSNGVSFTEQGLLFIQSAEKIMMEYNNIKKISEAFVEQQSLSVICSPTSILARCFLEFEKTPSMYNKKDILIEGGMREILKNIIAQTSRIGLVVLFEQKYKKYEDFASKYNIDITRLVDNIPIMAHMSARHPLALKDKIETGDLMNYPFVVDANVDHDDTLDILKLNNHLNILYVTGRSVMLDAICNDHYIAAIINLPDEDIKKHNLVRKPVVDVADRLTILLLKSKTLILSKREQDFIKYTKKALQEYALQQLIYP